MERHESQPSVWEVEISADQGKTWSRQQVSTEHANEADAIYDASWFATDLDYAERMGYQPMVRVVRPDGTIMEQQEVFDRQSN